MNNVRESISEYLELINLDEQHRFISWEHCYKHFQGCFKTRDADGEVRNEDCLNLGFYLASWGMYRSSGILWKDYTIFYPIVEEIGKEKYSPLRNIRLVEYCTNEQLIELLFDLKKSIAGIISSNRFFRNVMDEELAPTISPTDTLVTKILLGTLGCVPAYDTLFKSGCKELGISPHSNFTKKSFQSILKHFSNEAFDFEELRNVIKSDRKSSYPDMKIIDMYCWQIGRNNSS